jgi:hypothetical protein
VSDSLSESSEPDCLSVCQKKVTVRTWQWFCCSGRMAIHRGNLTSNHSFSVHLAHHERLIHLSGARKQACHKSKPKRYGFMDSHITIREAYKAMAIITTFLISHSIDCHCQRNTTHRKYTTHFNFTCHSKLDCWPQRIHLIWKHAFWSSYDMGPVRQKRCVGWPEAAFRLVSGWTILKVRMKLGRSHGTTWGNVICYMRKNWTTT